AELTRRALSCDFRRIRGAMARVLLVESGPRLLGAFPERLSAYARRALQRLGVEVVTGTAVERCDGRGVVVAGQRIEAATVVWAAGVQASPAGRWLGAETDRAGRVFVERDLSVPGHRDIFVVGDTAHVRGAGDRPIPGVAPAAKQAG